MGRLLPVVYVLIGLFVAHQHHYLHLHTFSQVLSAAAAILLWPLVLLGVGLHIRVS